MGRGSGVRERGDGIQVDFRYQGIRCRELLRLEPTRANLKFAANLKARIEHEIATGTFDYAKHFPNSKRAVKADTRPLGPLVHQVVEDYVDSLTAEIQPETLVDYREYAKVIASTGWGKMSIHELREKHVRDWAAGLKVGRKRIVNLLTPVRGALARAKSDEVIEVNPLAGFRVGRRAATRAESEIRDRIDPLTPKEVKTLAQASQGRLWTFWAWTGLRTGEVIALEWDDISADGRSARVGRSIRAGREKRPKTEAGVRTVPLMGPAARVIADMERRPGEKVFPNPATGEPFRGDKPIRNLFHADCTAVSVRRRRGPYQLRHTFASIALSSGEPLGWVSRVLGHSDTWQTLKHYAKWIPDAMPDVGSRMLRHDEGTAPEKPQDNQAP